MNRASDRDASERGASRLAARRAKTTPSGMDLSTFPEENPNPVLRVAGDGAVVFSNGAARRLSGLLDGEALTTSLREEVARADGEGANRFAEFESEERIFVFALTPVEGAGYVNLYGRDVTEERRALREVRDLAKFPEENPNPVLRVAGDGGVLFSNQAGRRLPGLLDAGVLDPALAAQVSEAYGEGANRVAEFEAGDRIFVFALTPVAGADYVNLYGRDVTEERRALREVHDLAKFPEENPNPVLRVHRDGEVLFSNQAGRRLSGLIDGAALARELRDVVIAAGAAEENSFAEFHSGERTFVFALTPVAGADYVNLYGRDVTEERRAQQEVIDAKNFNENILENLSNGVVTFDRELQVTMANPAARAILRLQGAVEGLAARNLWPGNEAIVSRLRETIATGGSGIELDHELDVGAEEAISVNLTTVPLGGGAGCMLILEDITREKRIKGTMVRFMSDSVVERLLDNEEAMLRGTSQEAAIFFSDIREFSSLSERLDAREMVEILNRYFTTMVDIVFKHGGTLDKFIGDALMAVFGAPFQGPEDADNAVATAVEMLVQLKDFNARMQAERGEQIVIGVGIDSGPVVAGTIGSPRRMDYTVIGDHVNVASRIEGANKYYGTRILVSEDTLARLEADWRYREIDRVRVPGRERPIMLHEILDHHTEASFPRLDEALAAFAEGRRLYRQRQWRQGAERFTEALGCNPNDRPTQIYLDRCWRYMARPPPENWSAITEITVK